MRHVSFEWSAAFFSLVASFFHECTFTLWLSKVPQLISKAFYFCVWNNRNFFFFAIKQQSIWLAGVEKGLMQQKKIKRKIWVEIWLKDDLTYKYNWKNSKIFW